MSNLSLFDLFFSFNGRIGRLQFAGAYISLGMVAGTGVVAVMTDLVLVGVLLVAVAIWSNLAVCAKRWHDTGASGWWTLLKAIPYVRVLVTFYLLLVPGDEDDNAYGPGHASARLQLA